MPRKTQRAKLPRYADEVRWAAIMRLLEMGEAHRLAYLHLQQGHPEDAARYLGQAEHLRIEIHELLKKQARREFPDE